MTYETLEEAKNNYAYSLETVHEDKEGNALITLVEDPDEEDLDRRYGAITYLRTSSGDYQVSVDAKNTDLPEAEEAYRERLLTNY